MADGCTISASELAAACGFSRVTLWRILQREDVRRFISIEHNYVYDRRLGKKRRTVSTYHVQMEDPLTEADEAHLQQLLQAQGLSETPEMPEPPAGYPRPTVQSEMKVVDNQRPRLQLETTESGSIPKPQNVLETIVKERLGTNARTPSPPPSSSAPVTQPRKRLDVDIWKQYPEIAHYVEEAETLLGDSHSRGFYLKSLKRLYPGHIGIWQRALGLAREQQHIRRSRGALFTRLLRTFAAEAGVAL